MTTEVAHYADFSQLRYAQCWEDADVLLQALALAPHHRCVAIASAGDNTLAMVAQGLRQVIAVDLNPAQIACLELRVAAYRVLNHLQLLQLLGSQPTPPDVRQSLYNACRPQLTPMVQAFWDQQPQALTLGFGAVGRFENYLRLFRRWILPLIHSPHVVEQLFVPRSPAERHQFYDQVWDNWRWQLLFRCFFSAALQGRLGRDPSFLRYAQQEISTALLARTRAALTELAPNQNPYLQWIVTGQHPQALPYALRAENFTAIQNNLDCLTWHCCSLEDFLRQHPEPCFDRYNLSNIFEYMSPAAYQQLLTQLCHHSMPKARLVYWNLFASRQCPDALVQRLRSLTRLQAHLNAQDRAFFYKTIVVEEVI
ncbi:MAG: DUF3419 family protein [Cyanobacteria bacterium P01_G01_bin.54]